MQQILPPRVRHRLTLMAALILGVLSLIVVRVAPELGLRLGRALFEALNRQGAIAPDAREVFESAAGLTAFAIACVAVGWLWCRLILSWRRMKASNARKQAPVVAHSQ
jgi:hypothetical protein